MPSKFARKPAASKKGWKYVQSKNQAAKKTRLALIVLGLFLVILFFSQIFKLTQSLFSPWSKSSAVSKKYTWDGEFNINLIFRAKDISLVSYSPQNQKLSVISLPANTFLDATHGFGQWLLPSVYGLGQSQKDLGGTLLKNSLSLFFGLPIDGFLDFSGSLTDKKGSDLIQIIRQSPVSGFNLLSNLKTDLTPFELLKLKWGMSKVRFDKVWQIDLEKSEVLDKRKLADGTSIEVADPVKLDAILADFPDPNFQSEHKTIAIFNSTNHPQLAQAAARIITNIGGDVIITSNGQNKFKTTQVMGEKSQTLDRLRQIFGQNGTIDPKDSDLVSSRAQINIFLGEDFFEKL